MNKMVCIAGLVSVFVFINSPASAITGRKHVLLSAPHEIVFFHISDTHIISAANYKNESSCRPSGACRDGRTDCKNVEKYDPAWIDANFGQSIVPTLALESFVEFANAESDAGNLDFVVIGGDLISNGMFCDADADASYQKFSEIMSRLDVPWYAINGDKHDTRGDDECFRMYEKYVGESSWHFVKRNNLFIGVAELHSGQFDVGHLQYLLDIYSDRDMKAFIFTHSAASCYDGLFGGNFRCNYDGELGPLIQGYADRYKAIIMMAGHNHANIYDGIDEADGIYHFTTTATMNYPAEARMVRISGDVINISMSGSFNGEIDDLSLGIIEDVGMFDPMTMYGDYEDRNKVIDLRTDGSLSRFGPVSLPSR